MIVEQFNSRVDFQTAATPDFDKILYTYVFRGAGYEYHRDFWRILNFHGEIHEKYLKNHAFCNYVRKYETFSQKVKKKL